MPTSLGQNRGEGHGSFGEDPYQLLGKGLKADHDQLFVVVAVSGAVISPDMHDDVLCICSRRLVEQAGRNVSRCGSSNCSDMQVASGVKPLSVHMLESPIRSAESLPSFGSLSAGGDCLVQFSRGVSGVVGVTVCLTADVEVCGVRVVATVCGVRVVATVCGVWVVATVCGVWVALEVRVCVVQVVAEVMMRRV